jgi:hypothetical protein
MSGRKIRDLTEEVSRRIRLHDHCLPISKIVNIRSQGTKEFPIHHPRAIFQLGPGVADKQQQAPCEMFHRQIRGYTDLKFNGAGLN